MNIEVSDGEALDKLSILYIKLQNIKNETKNKNVSNEINAIMPVVSKCLTVNNKLFYILKFVNQQIYDLSDKIRMMKITDEEYAKTMEKIFLTNEMRFQLKNMINSKSKLKEQKNYEKKKLKICLPTNDEMLESLIGIIEYFIINYNLEIVGDGVDLDFSWKSKSLNEILL